MLGHKSLETTQKYLGITNLDSLTGKIDAAVVIVLRNFGLSEPFKSREEAEQARLKYSEKERRQIAIGLIRPE